MQIDSITIDGIEYRAYDHRYFVSRCGKSVKRNKAGFVKCSPSFHAGNYARFGRDLAHRMVATAWIRRPDFREEVHHINGDRLDNRVENLEVLSIEEHRFHRHADNLDKFKHSKHSEEGKQRLRELRLGTKQSAETKAKIGAAIKALGIKPPSCKGRKRPKHEVAWMFERHHKARACIVHGVRYKTFSEAGRALGIRPLTLRKRCLSENFPEYQLG